MEPTDEQLTELKRLIYDFTEGAIAIDRMRRAWKFVENETGNAMWLSQAHHLCTEMGIPQGHIEDRLFEAIGKVQIQNMNDVDSNERTPAASADG